jgi:hypothetical protein
MDVCAFLNGVPDLYSSQSGFFFIPDCVDLWMMLMKTIPGFHKSQPNLGEKIPKTCCLVVTACSISFS